MRLQRYEAFTKIKAYIESCTTPDQLQVCAKMVMLFHAMYYDRKKPESIMRPCTTLSNLILQRRCEMVLFFG